MSEGRPIYLDAHATTPVDPEVLEAMLPYFTEKFGNPSAASVYGDDAEEAVEKARKQVADLVGAQPRDVIFTSGATESINIAIQGFCRAADKANPVRIALTPVEHKAVLKTVKALAKNGRVQPIFLRVDSKGRLDLDHLDEVCRAGVDLLCVMKANNEIGNVYPVEQIGTVTRQHRISLFTDATQAAGWLDPTEPLYGADALGLSGHKIYGPKGVGALVSAPNFGFAPVSFGGGQEKGLRPSTHNVPGIVGLGTAARICLERRLHDERKIKALRDRFQRNLLKGYPDLLVNGDLTNRLPNNLNVSFAGVPNDLLLARLRGAIAFSLGSACSASVTGPSHVLKALKLPSTRVDSSVRFGLSRTATANEINVATELLLSTAHELNALVAVNA